MINYLINYVSMCIKNATIVSSKIYAKLEELSF